MFVAVCVSNWNDILLPPFLFLIYFCFFCIVLSAARLTSTQNIALANTFSKNLEPIATLEIKPKTTPIYFSNPKEEKFSALKNERPASLSLRIYKMIEKLNEKQMAIVCSALHIEAKQQGVTKNLNSLKAEIYCKFQVNPCEVIAALRLIAPGK